MVDALIVFADADSEVGATVLAVDMILVTGVV